MKSKRYFGVGGVVNDRKVNVIIRSQLITSYILLGMYLLLLYLDTKIQLSQFLLDIKIILGGLIIAWVLWHTINYAVSKHVIKSNR